MAPRYGLVIDQERCLGCHTCTLACKAENGGANYWMRVQTEGGAKMDTARGRYPHLEMTYRPWACMHCRQAPCLEICPTEALYRRENGIVALDQEKCNGCQACLTACPYEAIIINENTGLAEKCHLCFHRVEEGLLPFCALCCEGEAIYFGDLSDPQSRVSQLVASQRAVPFTPEKGTEPSVYYCPPLPKRPL